MARSVDGYLALHHLDGVVRIPQGEYAGIPQGGLFAHFNLESTTVEVGKRYALPRILAHGHKDAGGNEVLPVLSFEDISHGECVAVRNNILYDALTAADFEHSMAHIQNINELKRYILERYQKSKPALSPEEILSSGVSRMLLMLTKAA